jgi:hypothetical protein
VAESYHRMMAVIPTCRQPLTQAELASSSTPQLRRYALASGRLPTARTPALSSNLALQRCYVKRKKYYILWLSLAEVQYIEQPLLFVKDGLKSLSRSRMSNGNVACVELAKKDVDPLVERFASSRRGVQDHFLKSASNAFRGSLPSEESRDVCRSSVTRGE